MMNRRNFISAAAAGAALLTRTSNAFAAAARARYDLIIKGGRVIDPSLRINAVRDVAISMGRTAAVEENIAADAADMIDARGKLVVPGLIDIHTHAARTKEGPGLCLADGVTGWVDAGSQGADHIADTIAVAKSSPQQGRVLINIGRAGILPDGDTMDIARADVGAARDAIAKNRDFIVGVEARLSRDVAGANDFEVLTRTQAGATAFNLPVMIHMGQTVDQAVARATVNASRIFPLFNDRGTLNVGAPADVALLELREGNFEFLDNYMNKIQGRQRLFPSGTVLAGKRVQRA